jgi:riboflavin biosynthesis pyrimidine reductase
LLLEGGGVTNGAFLCAGLVDEFNLVLCPVIDGATPPMPKPSSGRRSPQ